MDKKVDNNEKYDIHPDFAKWANFWSTFVHYNCATFITLERMLIIAFIKAITA